MTENGKPTYTETLARVDERQKAMHEDIVEVKELVKEQNGRVRELDQRVKVLETNRWKERLITGGVVLTAVGVPESLKWILTLFQ